MDQQELMIKFQAFEQQIQQIQQQLQAVEQGTMELNSLNLGLDELVGATGKEIMAPIGRGIFAKAKLLSEDLLVDVGEKNLVTKNIPDTKALIQGQIEKLGQVRVDLDRAMEDINQELTKEIMASQGLEGKECSCEGHEPGKKCECDDDSGCDENGCGCC
jgi:prefoldin alpha subunit